MTEKSPNTAGCVRDEIWVALLGRHDTPVDGVDDYCTFLARALAVRNITLQKRRLQWHELGRVRALWQIWSERSEWRGKWVLVQYTALSWSKRGFPFYALIVVATLRQCGARCAIVFHEPQGVSESRNWVSRIRLTTQNAVARGLHALASKSIFAEPLPTIPWLRKADRKAAFIPIGANIPEPQANIRRTALRNGASRQVAIFCLSDEPNVSLELHDVATATGKAAANGAAVHVFFVGRGTGKAEPEIARIFRDVPVEVANLGILSAELVSEKLAECDVMLCVRGKICPNRGSAIAGIACGLPIVGYAGGAEGTPLVEAGVVLVPYRNAEALGDALVRVLSDPVLSRELRDKSVRAQETYFSWAVIASAFIEFLDTPQNST